MTIAPPNADEIHQWGWEMGADAGRRLAEETDAFIGITLQPADASEGLRIYGRAFLPAFVRAYRTALTRHIAARDDHAVPTRRTATPPPASDERTTP
jgi:hypothetical protein